MLRFYRIACALYHNDKIVLNYPCERIICDDANPPVFPESVDITWENVDEIREKYGSHFYIDVWKTKKGRKACLGDCWTSIKEKDGPLNCQLKFFCEPINDAYISLKEILNYSNGMMALQYLTERGISLTEANSQK